MFIKASVGIIIWIIFNSSIYPIEFHDNYESWTSINSNKANNCSFVEVGKKCSNDIIFAASGRLRRPWQTYLISEENSSEEDIGCKAPWEQLHRSCVLFNKTKPYLPSWQDARNSCQMLNADLLTINDKEENDKILPLMRKHIKSFDTIKWWIGIRLVNDTWRWVDNEEPYAKLPRWASNAGKVVNPDDNSLLENRCGLLDFRGELVDEDCTSVERPFICEQIKTPPPPPPPTTQSVSTTSAKTTSKRVTTTKTTPKRVTTPYPIPTPNTVTPTVRQPTSKPTDKSTENPTDKTTGSGQSTSTSRQTETITVKPTDNPITESQTDITNITTADTTLAHQSTAKSTEKPTGRATRKPTDKHTGKPTDKHTGKPTDKQTGKPTNKPTGKPTDKPGRPSTERPTEAPEKTTKKPREEKDVFQGCFSVNYDSTCPPVEAFGISWPRSEAGKMVIVPCDKGHAKWKCDKNPVCWRDEPDVKQCTSESIQELTTQMEEFLSNTSNSEKALAFTENLAASVESESVMSEQDIFQSTKLMSAASNAKPKNSTEAKNIIKNVAKVGSLLVGKDKQNTWSNMNKESQRTVASSLLDSMETVSNEMLKSFDEPTVEKIEEENMAIELQVIDVSIDGLVERNAVFEEEFNSFAIPQENLIRFNKGGLAGAVFINYKNVEELLKPDNTWAEDNTERQIISKVISASLSEKPAEEELVKPIIFTMKTEKRAKNQEWKQLCSFWNFSLGYTGAWSQEGCSLKKYNDTHTTCQCNHLTNFAILMDIHSTKLTPVHATTLSYITYVGIIISIICLFLSWITFVCLSIRCVRGSRSSYGQGEANEYYGNSGSSGVSTTGSRTAQGERNSIHKNLVFCLFIAEVLFLAGIERTDNKIACSVIAGFLHYFFLSGFTWMFVEGIHILFMLVQVFDGAKSRMRYYYIIGYGSPLLIVGISALVYYEGYGTERYCWLTSERMFIWSFAGPVAFILLVNVVILVYAMTAVCKHSEYVFAKEKSTAGNFKAWIQGALALEVLLGLTWVFGYFYISEEAIPMAYLFTIFNSLQGLFIFVFHCLLNKKVRKEYKRFIDYPRRPVTSGTHSTKGHSGSGGPPTSSYHMNGSRKHSGFVDLSKDRRPSSKSTTSA